MNSEMQIRYNTEKVRLGDVAKYINGRAFKPAEWESVGLPIIRIQNLNRPDASYNYTSKQFEEKYRVKYGDLLFAWSASLGAYIWKGGEAWLNQHIFRVEPFKNCNKKYLFYSLERIVADLYSKAHGSGMVHVTKGKFEATEIPLPPLAEQERIVAKIEELFSELDAGRQEAEKALAQLKVYRQAVLKWAFEGRLTNEVVVDGELPEGWKWESLGNLCDPKRKCAYGVLVPGEHVEDGISLLRVGDIDDKGKINQSNMKRIAPEIADRFKRTFLQGGEVVISLVGAIGRTAVVPKSLKGANTARAVGVIPIADSVSAMFVEMMLRSPIKIQEHNNTSHEVARKTLNLEDVVKSKIPLPPLQEQHRIVQEIEARLSVCDEIESTLVQSLQQAEALRQSILKKAFEGKLFLIIKTSNIANV